ncbi:hypothetical protein, partial [Limoniibacter endophyticus]|uniref:hypothetical protein n=1 Tax=Limoniibacter endophyticus TaxID=1565040 RepID=UPI00361D9154
RLTASLKYIDGNGRVCKKPGHSLFLEQYVFEMPAASDLFPQDHFRRACFLKRLRRDERR